MIYRLLCRAALSVSKSFRTVSIAERNRYIENTPLGSPSGTAGEWKRLFFWLQKSGVNSKGVNAIPGRRYNPSVKTYGFASSPCTGEPRNAPQTLGGNPVQGSREAQRKRYTLSGDTTPQSRRFNPKPPCQLPLHRGAEVCPPSEWCEPRTREPRTAAEPPSQKQKNKPSQSGGEKKIFFLKGER